MNETLRPAEEPRRRLTVGKVIRRTLLSLLTVVLAAAATAVALVYTLATGPSETVRDLLVLSATQASATKWLPGLFLDQTLVDEIVAKSGEVQEDVIPMESHIARQPQDGTAGPEEDEWADAVDGMICKTYNGATFAGYILLVQDPARVYVGTASDFTGGRAGVNIFTMVEREGAAAAINGGEYPDEGGRGNGGTPVGLTYSKGDCVWDDGAVRTFIGFDKNNVLHAYSSLSREKAEELGMRDGVCFQKGNVLISNDGENVTLYYSENNIGMSQRTAIGQRADGTVILVVTDGRSASSMGATRNNIIDLMVEEGAVVAGMLDGGSSSMMYYADYYEKYDVDDSALDDYQRQGIINHFKAFTQPRYMPTYFVVAPLA